jgi:membrane protein insertase Oxa1/YidC/SpoIIIJ
MFVNRIAPRVSKSIGFRTTFARSFWWGKQGTNSPIQPLEPVQVEALSAPVIDAPIIDSSIGKTLIDEAQQQLTAITHWGDFKVLGLASAYTPTGWVESIVEITHLTTGLPWWGTIVASTVVFRLLLLPLAIKGQRASAKLAKIRPQLDPIQAELSKAKNLGDKIGLQTASFKMQQLFIKEKFNPLSSIVFNLGQIPLFIAAFVAFKKIGELPVPGLETGGFGWIQDLSVADPYYILPVVSSVANLLSFEVALFLI